MMNYNEVTMVDLHKTTKDKWIQMYIILNTFETDNF